jgi:hypothetical protein
MHFFPLNGISNGLYYPIRVDRLDAIARLIRMAPAENKLFRLEHRHQSAADLHLSGAMPVAKYVEFLTPSTYMDDLITQPFRPDSEGFLAIPTRPGLGIELNQEALKRFGV